jgi:DNA-binding response OmpR family regulator
METNWLELSTERVCVLLVDDQLMIAEAVRRMLAQDPAIELVSVQDATAALTMAQTVQPTVILQDLRMPGIDWLELLKRYRQVPPLRQVPVIVLSTHEDPVIKKACFEAGANDYLVKLPHPVEFLARVRLHSRAAQQQVQLRNALQALLEKNAELQGEIARRKEAQQALAELNAQIAIVSRQAGMAEVAERVLYHVSNALSSVNVSVSTIAEGLRATPLADLSHAVGLLRANESHLGAYLTGDPVGQRLPAFLDMLVQHWTAAQEKLTGEVDRLRASVERIKGIVNRQQSLSEASGALEAVHVPDLVEDALAIAASLPLPLQEHAQVAAKQAELYERQLRQPQASKRQQERGRGLSMEL